MTIQCSTLEELKKAAWRMFSQGKDIAVNTHNLIITIYNGDDK